MNFSVHDVTKRTDFEICKILKFPFFYYNVLFAFNICQKLIQDQSLLKYEIQSEFIWCNLLL